MRSLHLTPLARNDISTDAATKRVAVFGMEGTTVLETVTGAAGLEF
jgi:hypothetical protein